MARSTGTLQRFASSKYAAIGAPVVALLLVASVVATTLRGSDLEELPTHGLASLVTVGGTPVDDLPPVAVVRVDPTRLAAGDDAPAAATAGDPSAAVVERLAREPGVRSVRPVLGDWYAIEGLDAGRAADLAGVVVAQDETYAQLSAAHPQQWHLHNAGQPVAGQPGGQAGADIDWNRVHTADPAATGEGVVVAVVDNGVDAAHPALTDRIWAGTGEDACGPDVPTCHGFDFVAGQPLGLDTPAQGGGHGTLIAGAIAGAGTVGGAAVPGGIAPAATIMPLTITYGDDGFEVSRAAAAIDYAVRNGAHVVNASWGTLPGQTDAADLEVLREALDTAAAAGVVVVAAAGNQQADLDVTPVYPAAFDLPTLLTVAATTPADRVASFSNVGRSAVDVGAPGTSVVGTATGGGYATLSGTSMSAAVTTGVVAQVLSSRGGLDALPTAGPATRQAVLDGATRLLELSTVRTSARVSAAGALGLPPRLDGGLIVTGSGFDALDPDREFVANLNVLAPASADLAFTLGVWHDGAVHAVVGHDVEVSATDHIASVGGPTSAAGGVGVPRLSVTDDLDTTGRNFTLTSLLPTGRYVLLVEEEQPTRRAGFLTFFVGDPTEDDGAGGGDPGDGDDGGGDPGDGDDGDDGGDPGDGDDGDDGGDPGDGDDGGDPGDGDDGGDPGDGDDGGDPGDGDDGAPIDETCPTGYELRDGVCGRPLQECPAGATVDAAGICVPGDGDCPAGMVLEAGVCLPPVGDPDGGDGPGTTPNTPDFVPVFPAEGPMSGRNVDVKGDWDDPAWDGARVFFNEREGRVLAPLRAVAAVTAPPYPIPGSVHVRVLSADGRLLQGYEHAFTYVDGAGGNPGGGDPGGGDPGGGDPGGGDPGGGDPGGGDPGGGDPGGGDPGGGDPGGGDPGDGDDGRGPPTVGAPTRLPNGLTVDRFSDDHALGRLTLAAWDDGLRCASSPCTGVWLDTRPARP